MSKLVTFGLGGYCENCDPSHDHPLHNIVETIDIPDEETPSSAAETEDGNI